jgi:bifunctional polynucleotide phosphatase/kinase
MSAKPSNTSLSIVPQPSVSITSQPASLSAKPTLILFVGPPGAGKSAFFRTHFAPLGFVHVNQDTLGSRPKCIAAVKEALGEGKSVVVDNTNRDAATRKFYLDVAKVMGVEAR